MLGRRVSLVLLWLLPSLVVGQFAFGQAYESASYIRLLYKKYLDTEPSAVDLNYWMTQMQQGVTAVDLQAVVIGSDAYLSRYQGNLTSWMNSVYSEVLNRSPSPSELQSELNRLRQLGNNRVAWAKEFLRNSGSVPASLSNPSAGIASADLPGRLVDASQLLAQAVLTEVPGNRGWLLKVQANNLNALAESSANLLRDPRRDAAAANQAVTNLESAVRGLQDGLGQAGVAAPSSRLYANQAAQYLAAIRLTLPVSSASYVAPGSAPATTVVPAGGLNQESYNAFSRSSAELARESQQMVYLLRSVLNRDYYSDQLLRSAETFASGVDTFRFSLRLSYPLVSVRSGAAGLREQANAVSALLQSGAADGRVVQQWIQTVDTLNRLMDDAAVRLASSVGPPRSLPNAGAGPTVLATAAILDATDRAIAQCDALVAGYALFVFYSPLVPKLQAEVQNLRNSLAVFRSGVARGALRSELNDRLNQANQDLVRVNDAWRQFVGATQLTNAPDVSGLVSAMQELNRRFASGN